MVNLGNWYRAGVCVVGLSNSFGAAAFLEKNNDITDVDNEPAYATLETGETESLNIVLPKSTGLQTSLDCGQSSGFVSGEGYVIGLVGFAVTLDESALDRKKSCRFTVDLEVPDGYVAEMSGMSVSYEHQLQYGASGSISAGLEVNGTDFFDGKEFHFNRNGNGGQNGSIMVPGSGLFSECGGKVSVTGGINLQLSSWTADAISSRLSVGSSESMNTIKLDISYHQCQEITEVADFIGWEKGLFGSVPQNAVKINTLSWGYDGKVDLFLCRALDHQLSGVGQLASNKEYCLIQNSGRFLRATAYEVLVSSSGDFQQSLFWQQFNLAPVSISADFYDAYSGLGNLRYHRVVSGGESSGRRLSYTDSYRSRGYRGSLRWNRYDSGQRYQSQYSDEHFHSIQEVSDQLHHFLKNKGLNLYESGGNSQYICKVDSLNQSVIGSLDVRDGVCVVDLYGVRSYKKFSVLGYH